MAEYLQILSGGDSKVKKVNLKQAGNHPSIDEAINIIKKDFTKLCLGDQDILGDSDRWDKVIALIPDEELRKEIRNEFKENNKLNTSVARWNAMCAKIDQHIARKAKFKTKVSTKLLDEIMLQFAYPRLDINVSKGLNHLLKSPFCVHPKTGN